jgi:hypothetical protein
MVSKLMSDALHRFKRILIPELISPANSFWGGEKQLILNARVEITRVALDLPSFYTTEIHMGSSGVPNCLIRVEIGIGRSVMVREFNMSELGNAPDTFGDPMFVLSTDDIVNGIGIRLRFVTWGTSLKISVTALDATAAALTFRTTTTPGAGPVVAATIVGMEQSAISSVMYNVANATVYTVAQSAASVEIKGLGKCLGLTIYNEPAGGAILYLRDSSDGVAAAINNFTRYIPASSWWEMPGPPFYIGVINGIWSAAGGGVARVTIWSA